MASRSSGAISGAWQSLRLTINELRDCDDRVIARVTFEGRGRDGLEVDRQTGIVYTIRDGLATRIENYESWDEALEAAGLRE
jgi:ketosteroid isomerase-like protein